MMQAQPSEAPRLTPRSSTATMAAGRTHGWNAARHGRRSGTGGFGLRRIASVVLASLVALVVAAPGASLAQDVPATGGRVELVAGGDLASLDTAQAVSTIDYNAT